MAIFNTNSTLGGTGTSEPFFNETKIWAGGIGGTFTINDPIESQGTTTTLTARDCTIVTNRLGGLNAGGTAHDVDSGSPDTGSYNFQNVSIDLNRNGLGGGPNLQGGSTRNDFIWNDVKLFYGSNVYTFLGNFHARNTRQPIWQLNNVQIEGDINTDSSSSFSLFTAVLDNTSQFNNVSFYNGDSTNSKGGSWQTTTGTIYNNITFGPFGVKLNGAANSRMIARFTNQGHGGITGSLRRTNHAGVITNLDIRSLSDAAGGAAQSWFFDMDNGAHLYFVNWLPGRPQAFDNYGFTNIFNNTNEEGGIANVMIGTNPSLGNGEHLITFEDSIITSTGNSGVVLPTTAAWDVNTIPTYNADQVVTSARTSNGILFRNQNYTNTSVGSSVGNTTAGQTARLEAINTLVSNKRYRKYSWLQQPTNTTWGKEVTVSVPADGASDTDISTARTGGYDIYTGSEWETSTDISDPIDMIISSLGANYDTAAKTVTQTTTNRIFNGVTAVAAIKAHTYNRITNANVNAANDIITLPYTVAASDVDFGAFNLLFNTSTAVSLTTGGTQYVLPTIDFRSDDFVGSYTTTGDITFNGDVASGRDPKILLEANELNLDTTDRTIRGLRINNTIVNNASIGNTYEGLEFNGTSVWNIDDAAVGASLSLSQVFGTDVTFNSSVTINSSTAITIGTGNTNLIAGTNVTIVAPVFSVTLAPTTDASGNATFNGFFGVYNNTTDAVAQTTQSIISGAAAPTFLIPDNDSYTVYVSRENETGSTGKGYVTGVFSGQTRSGITVDITRNFEPAEISSVLYEALPLTITSTVSKISKTSTGLTPAVTHSAIQILFEGAAAQQTGATTLAGFFQTTNDQDYFDVMLENNLSSDIISAGGIGSTLVDSEFVTVGKTAAAPQQSLQAITFQNTANWLNITTQTVSAATVNVAINPAGITVGEVQTGVTGALDTNDNLTDIKKGVGYTVKQLDDLSIVDDYVSGSEDGSNL